jgi:hypothetical protein
MAQGDLVSKYISHVEKAAQDAIDGNSKCSNDILALDGMSGSITRHFYNNVVSMENTRYLEVGTWKGSSTCSAMFGNEADVVCIDNWSEFGDVKKDFLDNVGKFKGSNKLTIIEKDAFTITVEDFPHKFNIYLYDGHHSIESHEKSLTHLIDAMDDIFIFIVDDWGWGDTQIGTRQALAKLGLVVEYEKEYVTPGGGKGWWNGTVVMVLRKP